MGMDFLDSTETLTKHKFRLDKQKVPQHGICQISALNNPRRRLRCTAAREDILANADTGAEMDLISLKYAQLLDLNRYKLESGETQVQLADGSITYLGGKVFLDFKLGFKGSSSEIVLKTFYILDGMTSSLLLGEETLEDMDVFGRNHQSLVLEESSLDGPEVCTILWSDTEDKYCRSDTNAPPPLSGTFPFVAAIQILEGTLLIDICVLIDEVADTPSDRSLSQRAKQRVKNIFCTKKGALAKHETGKQENHSYPKLV